jgi:2-amino-4-hydroxy-6-hydroxymethyldihydropteridine diphosphokinase
MNQVILLTGGNLGDRLSILQKAKESIESTVGYIKTSSPLIESEAWGFESENAFLNQTLIVDTELSAHQVLTEVQKIEIVLGRVRKTEQWISRLIDIDILFFNNELVESSDLIIPHQHIQDRRFTLFALNTIIPNYIHPKLQLPISTLLNNCKDQSKVEVYHA